MRLLLSFLTFLMCLQQLNSQQTIIDSIEVDGLMRDYIIHLPSDNPENLPLVFNLHGYTSNAGQQQLYSQMDDVGEDYQFITCYPNGIANSWNVGVLGGSTADDVAFISSLIDRFIDQYQINSDRVYSCGMSNGGFMSYKLACELSDKIAAIASVTGSMVVGTTCPESEGVPVLQIHGTNDPIVPYEGGSFIIGIDDVIDFWIEQNGCSSSAPDLITFDDINTDDNSTVEHYIYKDCQDFKNVELMKIIGGAHTWPGAPLDLGGTNYDISASEEIWKFFANYSLSGNTSNVDQSHLHANAIHVYPNPVSSTVTLASFEKFTQVRLYNNLGLPVLSITQPTTDLSHLPSGQYYLRFMKDDQSQSIPLIINH